MAPPTRTKSTSSYNPISKTSSVSTLGKPGAGKKNKNATKGSSSLIKKAEKSLMKSSMSKMGAMTGGTATAGTGGSKLKKKKNPGNSKSEEEGAPKKKPSQAKKKVDDMKIDIEGDEKKKPKTPEKEGPVQGYDVVGPEGAKKEEEKGEKVDNPEAPGADGAKPPDGAPPDAKPSQAAIRAKKEKKNKVEAREKMKPNDTIRGAGSNVAWKVIKLLGSGGFGDVYKVIRLEDENHPKPKEFAMKTEMCDGDKRMLRLKIEVMVLGACTDSGKHHFVELIDKGKTEKFKYMVMTLVGPSLDDIRRKILQKGFTRNTSMYCSIQTFMGIRDLHELGYLHRDIKPQNYAVGLESEKKHTTVYLLDFGIARKFTAGDSKDVKKPRANVKFLGTLRFASRNCHLGIDQGRKDDLETWLYMVFDLFDAENGLPWRKVADRAEVTKMKIKFFGGKFNKSVYKRVPETFTKLVDYIDDLNFQDTPKYKYMLQVMIDIVKDEDLDLEKKLDWIGRLNGEKPPKKEDEEDSSGNKQTGSHDEEDDSGGKKHKEKKEHKEKGEVKPKGLDM